MQSIEKHSKRVQDINIRHVYAHSEGYMIFLSYPSIKKRYSRAHRYMDIRYMILREDRVIFFSLFDIWRLGFLI